MNILSRLTKIEEKVNSSNENSAGFCGCYKKHLLSVASDVYNDDPNIKIEIYPCPDLEKPICDMCNKRISKDDIEMAETLELFYGHLPDE
jgi:hypothetical protein